jgi:transposase-like protein
MLQIHPNARTTPAVRAEIARSDEPTGVLARRYGVSTETIRKWRKRGPDDCLDHSAKPHSLPWKATEEERAVVCALRRATNFALDDLTFVVTHFLPHLDRRRPRRHRQGTPHRRSCQGGLATRHLILLCHKAMILVEALAAGTSRDAAGEFAGDAQAQRGDGVCDVPFRPDRRLRVDGMSWEWQAFG